MGDLSNESPKPLFGSYGYHVAVEGYAHEYTYGSAPRRLREGERLQRGEDGWRGPTVTIVEVVEQPEPEKFGRVVARPLHPPP